MLRVHHLNCISTCPLGGKIMDERTETILRRGRLTCHCLLVETSSGLVLIDTGLGTQDIVDPKGRLSRFFLFLVRPEFRAEMTAERQIRRLGFNPSDVRHIVLSHLDFDHAGGLDDFPSARVHLLWDEWEAAAQRKTWLDRARYRPQQWSTLANWRTYRSMRGETWMGFNQVSALDGLPPEILLVPLPGHTWGHAGVAVRESERWLFYTGDAYFFYAEMDLTRPRCTPGLRFYQWMMEKDRTRRLRNQERLRDLKRARGSEVQIFCAHDVEEFEHLAGRSAGIPAEHLGFPVERDSHRNGRGI